MQIKPNKNNITSLQQFREGLKIKIDSMKGTDNQQLIIE